MHGSVRECNECTEACVVVIYRDSFIVEKEKLSKVLERVNELKKLVSLLLN